MPQQFLKVVIALSVVFLLVFGFEYRASLGAERARLQTRETASIERGLQRLERELQIAIGDLRFVADLVAASDGDARRLAGLGPSLEAFVRRRPGYLQVRLVSLEGREIAGATGDPDAARGTRLEELRDGDAVEGTRDLDPGEVFTSRMTLRPEGAAPGTPHEPVLRMAMRAGDGVVILDVHGGNFLGVFERDPYEGGARRMIVDSDGYWLRHRPGLEWGFTLEHGRGFAATFPEVWEKMVASPRGSTESDEGIFHFDRFTPRVSTASEEQRFWVFISLLPRELLDGVAIRSATPLLVTAIPLYFVLLVVCVFLARALERRRLADEALRALEEVRGTMMRAALDGIVVMDEKGIALEFNPSAQRIFGYTREEAVGKLVADLIIPPDFREPHRLGLEHYLETGEGPIIDKHVPEMTGMRKGGERFPVELTVCPVMVGGRPFFYGFLRDLSEAERSEEPAA
jgi:PAS domain S-box-containing protein